MVMELFILILNKKNNFVTTPITHFTLYSIFAKKNLMPYPNFFDLLVSEELVSRISKINKDTIPLWGKMNAGQMMAHCCVPFEYVYENKYSKPNFVMRWVLKTFVKPKVVNESVYKQGIPTGPDFIITEHKDFEKERGRLVQFVQQTQKLGGDYFDGKESHSFGVLNRSEWNNMFYKHLDHHLRQFGV